MLSSGDFAFPCTSKSLVTIKTTHSRTFTSTSLLFPLQTSPNKAPLLSLSPPRHQLSRARRSDGSARASAPKKLGVSPLLEMAGLGDELGSDFDDDDDDDDGESILLPLEKMKEWLENKPRGFGEGKVYDTTIEDQLFDEMLQSREAQAANLNRLKNESFESLESKREEDKKKADEVVPDGVRVRMTNLPKKKNVHRDLSSAFKGVPGLTSINPAVTGNKKTRDPICKGFGFVYFNSEKDANRFVDTFSLKSIAFGKIQKQIKCEILDSSPKPDSSSRETSTSNNTNDAASGVEVEALDEDRSAEYSYTDGSPSDEWEINISVEFDNSEEYDEEYVSDWDEEEGDYEEEDEDEDEDLDSVTELELNASGNYEQKMESESTGDSHSAEIENVRNAVKRLTVKDKTAKVPKIKTPAKGKEGVVKGRKLDISGSAKRLKVKEKAVLNDVFAKYGKKSALASKKER